MEGSVKEVQLTVFNFKLNCETSFGDITLERRSVTKKKEACGMFHQK